MNQSFYNALADAAAGKAVELFRYVRENREAMNRGVRSAPEAMIASHGDFLERRRDGPAAGAR